jgi:hypothetical protein
MGRRFCVQHRRRRRQAAAPAAAAHERCQSAANMQALAARVPPHNTAAGSNQQLAATGLQANPRAHNTGLAQAAGGFAALATAQQINLNLTPTLGTLPMAWLHSVLLSQVNWYCLAASASSTFISTMASPAPKQYLHNKVQSCRQMHQRHESSCITA